MNARPEHRGEHLLVLVLDEQPDFAPLRGVLAGTRDASVRLVAPAHVGPLHWATTDENDDRAAADARARAGGRAVAPLADVEAADAGDLDPVLAVEDALGEFDADRIVVLGESDPALEDALRRFDRPVAHVGGSSATAAPALREAGRGIMSGRSRATPYALLAGGAVFGALCIGIGFLVAALILWL